MNRKIEISVILFSDKGREINFKELKLGGCYLEQKEMTPDFFWGATGGFELTVDGYKTIFRGLEFYVALEAIRFLLHSLYWIEGITKNYDIDEEFPEAVVSRFSNQNFIKLSRRENDTVSFSCQSALSQVEGASGQRFFDEELFLSKDWAEAVKIGLKAYFDVLSPVLRDHQNDKKSNILENYIRNEWEGING